MLFLKTAEDIIHPQSPGFVAILISRHCLGRLIAPPLRHNDFRPSTDRALAESSGCVSLTFHPQCNISFLNRGLFFDFAVLQWSKFFIIRKKQRSSQIIVCTSRADSYSSSQATTPY